MKDVKKKGRGPRTESWAAPSIRDQREEEAVQCGSRRRWNCRSHVKKPSKEGGEAAFIKCGQEAETEKDNMDPARR